MSDSHHRLRAEQVSLSNRGPYPVVIPANSFLPLREDIPTNISSCQSSNLPDRESRDAKTPDLRLNGV